MFFAVNDVAVRRASLTVNPTAGARLTVLMGPVIFVFFTLAFGEMGRILSLPWPAYILFTASGVVQFIAGRFLYFRSISAIGASRASMILAIAPLFSLLFAVPILGETIGWPVAVGGLLVMLGPILIIVGESRGPDLTPAPAAGGANAPLKRGILLALSASVAWGTTPVFIKIGLNMADVPVLGTFLAYCAAASLVGLVYIAREPRRELTRMEGSGLRWYLVAGVGILLAQLTRYLALSEGDVTLVVLLVRSAPLFVLALTFLVNRHIEKLNRIIVAGCVLVVLGSTTIGLWG